jgi:hypothetical protein
VPSFQDCCRAAELSIATGRLLKFKGMKFFKQRFAAAPEGTAVLFFIVSRLLPAALDRYPRGLTGHVAHPSRSIQIFSKLGFAALYSTSVC